MFLHRLWASVSLLVTCTSLMAAEPIWIEGESVTEHTMNRHPWWYDQVKKDRLSGGDWISTFQKPGQVTYEFTGDPERYRLWIRANPTQAQFTIRLNKGPAQPVNTEKAEQVENVAADDSADLRFIGWIDAGEVTLQKGKNTLTFRFEGGTDNHGALDAFVLVPAGMEFQPTGLTKPSSSAGGDKMANKRDGKPGDGAARDGRAAASADPEESGWVAFDPPPDDFSKAELDLRSLNERYAGENGWIKTKGSIFIHEKTRKPVYFWAVNGPPSSAESYEANRSAAKTLAKRGVNLVRWHGTVFDGATGKFKPEIRERLVNVVDANREEGIYTHLSIYFPLWMKPTGNVFPGYDGTKHPFALLMFDESFQKMYKDWWRELLTTKSPRTQRAMLDEPAIMSIEIQNEDSFFFWTFNPENIPQPHMEKLQKRFAQWSAKKYGSVDKALSAWNLPLEGDDAKAGRLALRPLWNIANERLPRDQDTARFLAELQRSFYLDMARYLRNELGYKGLITASNWTTASPEFLGPIEKWTYTGLDYIDRHGYFGGEQTGEGSAWSIRPDHLYTDRSALRFDGSRPGKPKEYVHPVMDVMYNGLPSMISETTWTRPNRYRGEAPLYLSLYGALQGSDAIVNFAFDTFKWEVKPNFWMQQWTLMAPTQMGQFPAAALVFRQRLVREAELLVDLNIKVDDLLALSGTPLPQDASFDELRLADVPKEGRELTAGQRIDPLVHYVGRTATRFTRDGGPNRVADTSKFIDRAASTVTSATGQLKLNYDQGVLVINAPAAQGASGNLQAAGEISTADLTISSPLDTAHIIVVALDGKPLKESKRMLLQAMSEERTTGFRTTPENGMHKILSIGQDPWQIRELAGEIQVRRPDSSDMQVTALDANGRAEAEVGDAARIKLRPQTIYYLITAK